MLAVGVRGEVAASAEDEVVGEGVDVGAGAGADEDVGRWCVGVGAATVEVVAEPPRGSAAVCVGHRDHPFGAWSVVEFVGVESLPQFVAETVEQVVDLGAGRVVVVVEFGAFADVASGLVGEGADGDAGGWGDAPGFDAHGVLRGFGFRCYTPSIAG